MILEIEILEQIEDEPIGRSVNWLCEFIRSLGDQDPIFVLRGMWRGGYIRFIDVTGVDVPNWKCEELLDRRSADCDARIIATAQGREWVHGPSG